MTTKQELKGFLAKPNGAKPDLAHVGTNGNEWVATDGSIAIHIKRNFHQPHLQQEKTTLDNGEIDTKDLLKTIKENIIINHNLDNPTNSIITLQELELFQELTQHRPEYKIDAVAFDQEGNLSSDFGTFKPYTQNEHLKSIAFNQAYFKTITAFFKKAKIVQDTVHVNRSNSRYNAAFYFMAQNEHYTFTIVLMPLFRRAYP